MQLPTGINKTRIFGVAARAATYVCASALASPGGVVLRSSCLAHGLALAHALLMLGSRWSRLCCIPCAWHCRSCSRQERTHDESMSLGTCFRHRPAFRGGMVMDRRRVQTVRRKWHTHGGASRPQTARRRAPRGRMQHDATRVPCKRHEGCATSLHLPTPL